MKAILNKFKKDDTGASSVIEMTLIFPLVLFVMGFLIYIATYDGSGGAFAAERESDVIGDRRLFMGDDLFLGQKRKKLLTKGRGAGIIIGTNEAERCPLSPPDLVPKG